MYRCLTCNHISVLLETLSLPQHHLLITQGHALLQEQVSVSHRPQLHPQFLHGCLETPGALEVRLTREILLFGWGGRPGRIVGRDAGDSRRNLIRLSGVVRGASIGVLVLVSTLGNYLQGLSKRTRIWGQGQATGPCPFLRSLHLFSAFRLHLPYCRLSSLDLRLRFSNSLATLFRRFFRLGLVLCLDLLGLCFYRLLGRCRTLFRRFQLLFELLSNGESLTREMRRVYGLGCVLQGLLLRSESLRSVLKLSTKVHSLFQLGFGSPCALLRSQNELFLGYERHRGLFRRTH